VSLKRKLVGVQTNSNHLPVIFESPNILSSGADSDWTVLEIPDPIHSRILCELGAAVEVTTQLYCYLKNGLIGVERRQTNGRYKGKATQSWYLNAIIYGPKALEETIGGFLSKYQLYLQDPLGCNRSLPYRNPHIIPLESGEVMMTDMFEPPLGNLEIERLEAGPDLLAKLMEDDIPLQETKAPAVVSTTLFR
jgi:SWI/SNF-related matrix-associated actin-dependent regulator of chromatin subfamily A3